MGSPNYTNQQRDPVGRFSHTTGTPADRSVLDDRPNPPSSWPQSRTVTATVFYSRRPSDDPGPVDVQATIPPLLADLQLNIPADISQQSVAAERALATLDVEASRLPPSVTEAVTISLLRAESVSSSRIEGLSVSNRRLSEAFYDPAAAKRLAREVAANTVALEHSIRIGSERRPLTTNDLRDIHAKLMERVPFIDAGELRTSQNWIGPSDDPSKAEFVPPPVDQVEPLLDDLCRFVERDDIPATVRAAIGHAQFEAIHPFADGNGRVGRCLISIVLRRGAETDVIPPISGVCVSDTAAYFHSLQQFQQHANPWPWVSQFCEATETASGTAQRLSNDIIELQEHWAEQAGRPRSGSISNRLIDVLPTMSFTDADVVAERLGVSTNLARSGLNQLEQAGVLSTIAGRKRNRVWRADGFHELLDRYSAGFDRQVIE